MADIIDVNIGDSTLEVFWQDEVELNLDLNLMYIKSGQKEIQDYVDNVSKPEIDNYIETEAKPLVTQIVNEIAEPTVAEYIETTVKPELDEYANNLKPDLQEYVTQAQTYANNSQTSAEASAGSAAASLTSANNAKTSETNAKTYENNALSSKNAAKSSQDAAKLSETNAKESEDNAKQSELNAKTSETNALNYKNSAQSSATTATDKANITITKAQEALNSANNAKVSETNAKTSETKAKTSETNAASSATSAENSKNLAKQYADSVDSENIVHKTGNEVIGGNKTFLSSQLYIAPDIDTNNSSAEANVYNDFMVSMDKNNNQIGFFGNSQYTNGNIQSRMGTSRKKADGSFIHSAIEVGTRADGTVFTNSPSAPLSANDGNIVNTYWFNKKIQVVSTLPSSPDANVFYFVTSA